MLAEVFRRRQRRLEPRHLIVRPTPDRRHRRFVRLILEVTLPVDLFLFCFMRLDLRHGRFFRAGTARLARLGPLLEDRVLEQLFLHELAQLHARHLQQLDRLLKLRRHDELLR